MSAVLPPPERLLLVDGIIATNNSHMCDVHRIDYNNAMLLARIAQAFGGLLRLPEMALDYIAACFVFCDRRAD